MWNLCVLYGLMGIDVVLKWSLLICLEGQTWFVIFISSAWLTDTSKQLYESGNRLYGLFESIDIFRFGKISSFMLIEAAFI